MGLSCLYIYNKIVATLIPDVDTSWYAPHFPVPFFQEMVPPSFDLGSHDAGNGAGACRRVDNLAFPACYSVIVGLQVWLNFPPNLSLLHLV